MKTTLKIKGLRELGSGLDQFKRSTASGVLSRVLKKAAKPIADTARRNAPVDQGELRDSVKVQLVRQSAGKAAFAAAMRGGASRKEAGAAAHAANREAAAQGASATVRVAATAPHAHLVEWGTSKMPAQPFLGPALDAQGTAALNVVRAELATEIEKTARRIAKRAAKKG